MASGLSANSTLRDVVSRLDDADRFVSSAYGVLHAYEKSHGPVALRLGITGTGKLPNYRIDAGTTQEPLAAIDGNNHRPWPPGEEFSAPDNWSTETMSKAEVEALLGELRGFSRKGRS